MAVATSCNSIFPLVYIQAKPTCCSCAIYIVHYDNIGSIADFLLECSVFPYSYTLFMYIYC